MNLGVLLLVFLSISQPLCSVVNAFSSTEQAEDGLLLNGADVETTYSGYQGTGYVGNIANDGSGVEVFFNVPKDGVYGLSLRFQSPYGEKYNDLYINGDYVGSLYFEGTTTWTYLDCGYVFLTQGNNSIALEKNWGYVFIDSFNISSKTFPEATFLEAENGTLFGGADVENSLPGYTGTGYVGNIVNSGSGVQVYFNVPSDDLYNLTIRYQSPYGDKINDLYVNEQFGGSIDFPGTTTWSYANGGAIFLNKGTNAVMIQDNWGYIFIDSFNISGLAVPRGPLNRTLVTPDPSDATKKLFRFLLSRHRNRIVSGQACSEPNSAGLIPELVYIGDETGGVQPALAGFEFENYSPVGNQSDDGTVSRIIAWYNERGGIPEVQFHWCSPMGATGEWWQSFYTAYTTFDVSLAVQNGTIENQLILRDLDVIAGKFKILQDNGVPVLWRPLHEAEGGWFWWGAKGPGPLKQLYNIMFNKFVYEHKLTNLIWVWVSGTTSVSPDWYPGEYLVDIIGADIYAPAGNYGPSASSYYYLLDFVQGKKLVALCENGPIPNPDELFKQKVYWSWFMTWDGYYITDGIQNSLSSLNQTYHDSHVVTLQNLPKWK